MADLTEQQSSQAVKITGADSTGIETNYVNADANGNLKVIETSAGPVTPGTVAANSDLIGGQFNTALPVLTNGQQSALQTDTNGKLWVVNTNELFQKAVTQNVFSVTGLSINSQSAETKLLSIVNPNASGKTVYIISIFAETDITNPNYTQFKYYVDNVGISAGTVKTPLNHYISSAVTSVTTCATLPTVTTLGNVIMLRVSAGNGQLGEVTQSEKLNTYVILPPNTNLVLTGASKANATPTNFTITWIEV